MKWSETTASQARYGDVAERVFGQAEVIAEFSEADYQGSCNVLAVLPGGQIAHYEWSYGSCSGCDTWEAEDLDDDQIEAQMRHDMVTFPADREAARKYFHATDTSEFGQLSEAFRAWDAAHPYVPLTCAEQLAAVGDHPGD